VEPESKLRDGRWGNTCERLTIKECQGGEKKRDIYIYVRERGRKVLVRKKKVTNYGEMIERAERK
jgi:hypothetical protein